MSTRQERAPGRTRRNDVEDILGLVPGATAAEADALMALFADVDGPAHAGELPGEAAAVAAFAAARPPAVPVARRARILASLTTLLTVKTAAAALAVTSVGGLALAAGTGTLPTPLASHPHHGDRPTTVVDNPTTVVPTPTAAALRDAATAAATVDRDDAAAGKNASASYAGLCTAYAAGRWDNGRAAGNPAFARLVAAAPGGDVTDFCQALATESPVGNDNPGKSVGKDQSGKAAPGRARAAEKSHGKASPPAKTGHRAKPAASAGHTVDKSAATSKPPASPGAHRPAR